MEGESFTVLDLEKHQTKDVNDAHINGELTVVWRDWDKIVKNEPKMIYVSSVNPGEIKGPHIHTKRNSYFVCINCSLNIQEIPKSFSKDDFCPLFKLALTSLKSIEFVDSTFGQYLSCSPS